MRRKILAFLLCLALLPAVPAAAEGETEGVLGETLTAWTSALAEGAALTAATYWTGEDYRAEHYLEVSPGGAAAARVVSGARLCSKGSLEDAAAALEAEGLHALAAVNGGFFNLFTLEPVGMVAQNGVLRADNEGMDALGFRADGSAVLGHPGLALALEAGGETLSVQRLNHSRGAAELALFTDDFAARTKAAGPGWNLVCVPDMPVPLHGAVTLTLESVSADDGAVPIPEGRIILSQGGDTEADAPAWIAALSPGDTLALTVACAEEWEDVESAVGIVYPLLRNGAVAEDLDDTAAPRTAVGLRADGTLVLYTLDGRQRGYSAGAGLEEVALRLRELGCVAAGALDGGGSTDMCAILPGGEGLSQINRPSGGEEREVVNHIFLTTERTEPGAAAYLALYPTRIDALAGAEIPLDTLATDGFGYAAPAPEELTYTVSGELGRVEDGMFLAERAGEGTVSVSADGVGSASIPVRVVETPDSIEIYGEVYRRNIETITLAPGQEVDFYAVAEMNHVTLRASDECFTWALEPEAGEIDGTGHLIPAAATCSGRLTVTAGETVREAMVKIWSGVPFADVAVTDVYFDAVKYVYDHDIFQGTGENLFEPATVMTRGMLVTVLWRLSGEPEAEMFPAFADVLPEDWYGPAVAWAAETGLVLGYSEDAFGPLDDLTREQILTILHRWAGSPEAAEFLNAEEVSPYARAAVSWAFEAGLIPSVTEGGEPMTRAAVAEVLARYLEQRKR